MISGASSELILVGVKKDYVRPIMEQTINSPQSKRSAMWRGAKMRCPNCDKAPLFRAYLKPVEKCANCKENWGDVRADDGPAWLTILIVGHLLAPIFHPIAFNPNLSPWTAGLILAAVGALLSLIVLPRAKGAMMGLIWKTGAPTS